MVMKKKIYLVILSTLIALLSSGGWGGITAFASTSQAQTVRKQMATGDRAGTFPVCSMFCRSHAQYFHGNSYSYLHFNFRGHNLNNSGNQGHNRGYAQNFGGNGGNLLTNRRRTGNSQRTSQWYDGNSYSRNFGSFSGYNQNNSGNQGYNEGVNEDHGGNAGNQIVN